MEDLKKFICAKASFTRSALTASVNMLPGSNAAETVEKAKNYFLKQFAFDPLTRIDFFYSESEMHEGKQPFLTCKF